MGPAGRPHRPSCSRWPGFLTAFSGFYFTVYVLTDATYRQEFLDEVLGEMRQAFAVRAVYLAAPAPGG